ncbi:hypothetical protein [Mesoplasma coleopterae]|uniref:Uncharacterized protein n=1 Tax=Mesoplasma coleopterae TaxID=324078 RepID=A0A2K8P2J5_9MOLU|nr:hypothetical protein [Mesoplasma coleopterae]ATZ20984.1 hypothetical protein MCOLE_v1c04720 [Mesoplasma coleopterae]
MLHKLNNIKLIFNLSTWLDYYEESKNNSKTAIREDVNLVNYHKGSLTSDTRRKIKKSNYKTRIF